MLLQKKTQNLLEITKEPSSEVHVSYIRGAGEMLNLASYYQKRMQWLRSLRKKHFNLFHGLKEALFYFADH